MKKYDLETFVKDIETVLKADLNTYIIAINTEKADWNLSLIDAKAYIFQSLDDKVINFSPCVFYYVDDIVSTGIGPATMEEISVEIVVILSDTKDGKTYFRLLRYLRALKELFNAKFNAIQSHKKIKIDSLVPIQFALQNSSNFVHAIGIKVTTEII